MPGRLTCDAIPGGVARTSLACALAVLLPSLLLAHGSKGEREVAVFDLAAASSVPEGVARAASNGVEGAFSAGTSSGAGECLPAQPNALLRG